MDRFTTAATVFNTQAKKYEEQFMNVELYHNALDLFCNHITKDNADILDIACGPGNISKYLLTKRPSFNILGIDLAVNMLSLAKANEQDSRRVRYLTADLLSQQNSDSAVQSWEETLAK